MEKEDERPLEKEMKIVNLIAIIGAILLGSGIAIFIYEIIWCIRDCENILTTPIPIPKGLILFIVGLILLVSAYLVMDDNNGVI